MLRDAFGVYKRLGMTMDPGLRDPVVSAEFEDQETMEDDEDMDFDPTQVVDNVHNRCVLAGC